MRSVGIIGWAARSFALFVTGAFLLLLTGEMLNPFAGPLSSFPDWAGILLLILSITGMLLAWKWELSGALFSLASLVAFVVVVGIGRYDIVAMTAIPGFLFLADWGVRHRGAASGHKV